ncbi:MAG: sulfite exporter TauE/SafE family protein [Bacteroidales bacterium]|nr:sulfite exporter TauE/SafE family protein [Bacteroidales bacterium]
MMMTFYSGLLIGLVGSLHCIGMCGPIAIALPLGRSSMLRRISGGLAFNLGRTFTYAMMGALFGLLGEGIRLAGFQQWVSVITGVLMILSVLFPAIFRGKWNIGRLAATYTGKLVSRFRLLFGKNSYSNLFLIGLLNGLLPCGLVYVALAGAIQTNQSLMGALFMMMFGLGTLPVMLSVSLIGNIFSSRLRLKLVRIIPVFVVVLGIIFILRGLSLGIPFISPMTEMLAPKAGMMHH